MQIVQFVMIYITLIAVFTTLNYFVALTGGVDFHTDSKESTLLASFSHTVTHATFGTSPAMPQNGWAILTTTVLRLCALALLVATIRAAAAAPLTNTAAASAP